MSASVTVHEIGTGPSPEVVTNPLSDFDAVRKDANEKLRIRRLVQVRQQSKELAAKVRQNYQQAKVTELAKIERTKREEVKAWKRKQVRQLQDEYARCIGEVGEAHKAAEAAEECAVWFEEKRATQQAVAMQRGRKAEKTAARERERKEALKEAKAHRKPYVPAKSIAVQANIPDPKLEPVREAIPVVRDEVSSTEPTLSPYEQFRSRREQSAVQCLPSVRIEAKVSDSEDELYCPGMGNKENIPSKGQDYSASAFTSPSDIRPSEGPPPRQRLQPFTQITELIQQRRQQQQRSRERHDESTVGQQKATHHRPTTAAPYGTSYGTQKAVQFDDTSENTLSFPTSTVLTRDDHRPPPILASDGSPRKVRPRKLVDQPKVSPVQQNQADSKTSLNRGQAVLPTGVVPESSTSSASYGASTKVQYYDYNTRFTKEYDQPMAFVHREERRVDDPTAMEEANRYEKLQQELAAARRTTVDRTKPALEKQQTRKDYEKLSKELDNLTRSETKLKSLAVPTKTIPTETTIKQKAEARQRKANEAIENLLQQRALVTCPVVRTETSIDVRKRARSGSRPPMVNVAEIRSDTFAPASTDVPAGQNVSSDSCASIVLGTFERPAIPLPTGDGRRAEGEGAGDKIDRLKELLEQLDEQRRLLAEELAKERKPDPISVGGVEELCAAMQKNTEVEKLERMKRRQEELLEQQRLLQNREREVEELERQLREKMAQLKKNKQQREDDTEKGTAATVHVETRGQKNSVEVVEQPSTATSSCSLEGQGEDNSERTGGDPVPVKIIITVNDKSTPSKKKHKKKLPSKKSPKVVVPVEPVKAKETPARGEKSVETEQPMAVTKEGTAVRTKKGPIRRVVEMDFSPGSTSTTSTVYRELPPKIGGLKINTILPQGPAGAKENEQPSVAPKHQLQRNPVPKPSSKPAPKETQQANLNPQLVKYIQRLLGMSRQSIDQLGVSSTTVSTPNASLVNVSSNAGQTVGHPPVDDESERMDRLRKFIDENYNFLQEIDETLKRSSDQSVSASDDSRPMASMDGDPNDVSRVEDVWMKTLRKREKGMKAKQVDDQTARPALVKVKTKKKRSESGPSEGVPAPAPPVSQPLPAAAAPPVADAGPSVSHGSNRIVTKEASLKSILKSPKRDASPKVAKIITPQGHVEIINLSDREEQEILDRYSQLTERCSQRITELSQMINQIGLSKDSGIAMSRPLTASDIRESPSEECSQAKEPPPFEPFLKDIHKPVLPPSVGRLHPAAGPAPSSVPSVLGSRKPPPVAITRYSPQLDLEVPVHELSTILEIDTPATVPAPSASKVYDVSSLSVAGERSDTAKEQLLIEARNKLLLVEPSSPDIGYARFPNYEEYTTGSPGPRMDLEQTEQPIVNETGLRLDLTEDREPERLQYRSFPGAAPSFDITEESRVEKSQSNVSDSSLPDVVAELKKFNIILKPFDQSLDDSNRSTPLSEVAAVRGEGERGVERSQPPLDLVSLGHDLEKVLRLPWAASMLKKNHEHKRRSQQQEDNSTSSSFSLIELKGQNNLTNKDDNDDDDNSRNGGSGKPPNLAKFIARELMIRTQSDLQSLTSSSELSSSPGSHSALLRSLLSISNLEHTSSHDGRGSRKQKEPRSTTF
ncbi:AGAP003803-PA-like protein [Anopheles sinensis]|uniref:AGAP003803-PA-like protein n=1 Tax=Anopheles sinensis TaxID=74873 RepID=A0A084VBQ2_ANOSI|nr:AGAP003803-PA-like protein [Anopheles sinensis]